MEMILSSLLNAAAKQKTEMFDAEYFGERLGE